MQELKEIDIIEELKKLFLQGFVKSLRKNNTGIGYTLETNLKIKENNIAEPDFKYNNIPIELKAQRESASSRITLITKVPHWSPLKAKEIIEKFGYLDKKGRRGLKIVLTTLKFNQKGFKLELNKEDNVLNILHKDFGVVSFFKIDELMTALRKKIYGNLLLVLAESKKEKDIEYFRYNKAILLKNLSETAFEELLNNGTMVWEFRMHLKPTGVVRDHGPGFRISRNKIKELYEIEYVIFDGSKLSEE
jgi:hypothetical protein